MGAKGKAEVTEESHEVLAPGGFSLQLRKMVHSRLVGLHHGLLLAASAFSAAVFLGAAFWLTYFEGFKEIALYRSHEVAEGIVTNAEPARGLLTRGWALYYVFGVEGRKWGAICYLRARQLPQALYPGSHVPVEYLTGNPQQANKIAGTDIDLTPYWLPAGTVASAILLPICLAGAFFGSRRAIALFERGKMTTGRILGRRSVLSLRFFGLPPFSFHYEYLDDEGRLHRAKMKSYYPEALLELLVGDRVTVFYNPLKPARSILLEALTGPLVANSPALVSTQQEVAS